MSSADALGLIALILCAAAAVYSFRDFRRAPEYRKLYRALSGMMMAYMALVFAAALLTDNVYLIRAGALTRYGVMTFAVLKILDIWLLRKHQCQPNC